MKVVAISDLHGYIQDVYIPPCDVLLIAGDVCPVWSHKLPFQRMWLKSDFSDWLAEQPAEHIVGVAGNHDYVLEAEPTLGYTLPWTYLRDESIEIEGKVIHGSPWSPQFGNWAFMKSDVKLADEWAKIPDDVDILMVHTPMYGVRDRVLNPRPDEDPNVGSQTLRDRILDDSLPNLELFVFGHIHEGYGVSNFVEKTNEITMANTAHMDENYDPKNPPVVFNIE